MRLSATGGLINRTRLQNYKSIAACSVDLKPLTILVGPNGAGKSNFLDGLRFTAESLRHSLDHALRERGGIDEVRRRADLADSFAIRIDLQVTGAAGWYGFEIGGAGKGRYVVRREECVVRSDDPERCGFFRVRDGDAVTSSISHPPPSPGTDRLYLLPASAYRPFRPMYDALAGMGFYNLDPERIRELQAPDSGDLLERSGRNIASVLDRIRSRSPANAARIDEYLSAIVPGVAGVETKSLGPRLTVEFREQSPGGAPRRFLASGMSDGTLHVLGVLVALFQRANGAGGPPGLIGIEEPETALHPAAAGALTDILQEASEHVQVIVTSHSADLLDRDTIAEESIVAVTAERGETRIAPLDETGRTSCRKGLFTAGELLRMDQLTPSLEDATPADMDIFLDEGTVVRQDVARGQRSAGAGLTPEQRGATVAAGSHGRAAPFSSRSRSSASSSATRASARSRRCSSSADDSRWLRVAGS